MKTINWNIKSIVDDDGQIATKVDIFRTDASKPFPENSLHKPLATVSNIGESDVGVYVDADHRSDMNFRYLVVKSGSVEHDVDKDDPFHEPVEPEP